MTQGITSTGQGCRPWPAQRAALSALLRRTTWQTRLCEVLSASLSGFSSVSVCLQAVPARSPPAYVFFLVRSCRGGTSPKKHSGLQPIMLLSRYNVCKMSRAFKSTSGTVLKSSPYTLYKLKGGFLNRVFWKFGNFSLFQTTSYIYSILKRVFGNLILKFHLENFLHQYESIGPFGNTVLKISQFWTKRKTAKQIKSTLPFWRKHFC